MSRDKPETEVAKLLAQLRVDPPDNGFEAALSRRLVRMETVSSDVVEPTRFPTPRPRLWQRPGFVGACWGTAAGAVAGVAAFLLMAQLHDNDRSTVATGTASPATPGMLREGPTGPGTSTHGPQPHAEAVGAPACPPHTTEVASRAEVVVVPAGKVALVRLHFEVPVQVDEAQFSVLLPRGLSFFSEGEALPDRSFHWTSALTRGENEVPVAVVAQEPGKHRLTATATIDGEVVVHEVVFDVREPV